MEDVSRLHTVADGENRRIEGQATKFLFKVDGIIDTWTPQEAEEYAARGYVHYHELVKVSGGAEHPDKVVWLKHTARTSFNLDGGPHPELGHWVTPGVDYEFIPNGKMPYNP